ncbi:hypothetical protein ACFOWM_07165 [Ferruginibacter yonginensis]|uniref:Lipocalin-like domain-containing protein n=1 Tax=Ferruginibacter yonginensis TaxID=1310416 RepID=A0ABV8QQW9_9BACT
MKTYFLCLLLFVATFSSCKKDNVNNGIIGKWKLIEVYDGYANGGNFQWNNISNDYSHSLEFSENGQYLRQENINGNNQQCIGTYILQTDNNLEINSNCNTAIEKMKISELTTTILIIDRQVIEGKIRYKYTTIN